MDEDVKRLEQRVRELTERLERVEEYLAEVEDHPFRSRATPVAAKDTTPAKPRSDDGLSGVTAVSLVGRTLIVLGGAFLVRWFTQSGTLPQEVGSIIGMAYALLWITMADISAGKGQRASAAFHGITGAMIALPLLVEATTKFKFLPPVASATSLAMFVILGLVVAGRRRLRILAWIVAVPAAPLAFILATQTKVLTPFLSSLLVLGFVTLWLGYLRRWQVLATLMAAGANVGMMLLVLDHDRNARATGVLGMSMWEALLLLIGLIAVYFGSFSFRVFRRKRTITVIEMGQTLASTLIGVGGTAVVLNAREHSMLPLGIVCIVLAVACYVAAYGFLPRRKPNRRNFLFYTLLGLTMWLMGCELTFSGPVTSVLLAATALIAGLLAKPISSPVLYIHGSVYLFAAIVRSGVLAMIARGFVGTSWPTNSWATGAAVTTFIVTLAYPWFRRPTGRATDVFAGRRAVELLSLIGVLALGIAVVALVTDGFGVFDDGHAHTGALATTRTLVLALSAVALAWGSRRAHYHLLGWPVYLLLAMGAVKIVLEDIKHGDSSIMFLAFGLYGGALILAPRLLHRAHQRAARYHEPVEPDAVAEDK